VTFAPTLALTTVPARSEPAAQAFVFLHGILGSGANWRGFAKRLLASERACTAGSEGWLVDLRMHGRSLHLAPPHTVSACAEDLAQLQSARARRVHAVLGHSFGGKVALAYAAAHPEGLEHVIVVDSNPGPSAAGSETTERVLQLLRVAPPRFASREAFTAHFVGAGLEPGVVAWLAMNLVARDDGHAFRLDLGAIEALLADYLRVDLFSFVEAPPPAFAGRIVVVAGGRSPTLDPSARARVLAASARDPGRVALEIVPGAGHWVHVDAPDALHQVVCRHLDA